MMENWSTREPCKPRPPTGTVWPFTTTHEKDPDRQPSLCLRRTWSGSKVLGVNA